MLVCEQYETRISALIDDELTSEDRTDVLKHLSQCPACRAYWEQLLLVRDAIRNPEHAAPAGFADAVMARVRETEQDRPLAAEKKVLRFPGWKRYAGLAACCAVVLLGIFAMDFLPGMVSGGADECARNGAAPQMYAEDSLTGSAAESYGINTADSTEAADMDSGVYASDNASCRVETAAATLMTSSTVAGQWVEENLGEDWVSGACYMLSEEQYSELREVLETAGEMFNEIIGETENGGYLLIAE